MRPSHILPSISVVILLAAALPAAAGAQGCFDYYGGGWPEARVMPVQVPDIEHGSFTMLDGLVAVVDSAAGLTVVDIESASVVLNMPIPGYTRLAGHGRNLIMHDKDIVRAYLLNLDNPAQPAIQILDWPAEGGITAAALGTERGVLIYDHRWVLVFQLPNTFQWDANHFMYGVGGPVFVGNQLLLPGFDYFSGLAMIECGPVWTDLRDWIPLPDDGGVSLAVHGTHAYIARSLDGIHIVDFADPDLMVEVGTFGGGRAKLAVFDGVLYVNSPIGPLKLYDLTNPTAPTLIANGSYTPNVFDNYDIFAGPDGVLKITENRLELLPLQCSATSAAQHSSRGLAVDVVPNPFNPSATISLALPAADVVTVEVYDLAGRHVRTLARDRAMEAGSGDLVWDGRDDAGRPAASGVYLARVRSRAGSVETKMALVR